MIRPIDPPTRPLKILLVEDDSLVGMGIKAQLQALGHFPIGQASNDVQAVEMFRALQPDVVLVDIRLDTSEGPVDGIELASKLLAERRCPMIIISAYSDRDLIERASTAGVFGYLTKPVSNGSLQGQIEIAVARFTEHERLRQEKDSLAQNLETRKLAEKAKGILMRRLHLSEEDAHKRLQQESQKRRISLADLSKKILESEELLGGT